jgi:uncharacterized SAM-binding protein YcdF (DUF218 family)
MSFAFSKIIWLILAPSHVLAWLVLGAAIFSLWRKPVAARWLTAAAALVLLLVGILPLQLPLIQYLEDQYPRPQAWPAHVDGIVTLGGGLNTSILQARGVPAPEGSEARLVAAYEAARRYPQARLIFSGGSALLGPTRYSEAQAARAIFQQMGQDPARLLLEDRSRNTSENLRFSMRLAKPRSGETWLLATSALHMPRAMLVARQLDWPLQPWPTDYITAPGAQRPFSVSANLAMSDAAAREWLGLLVYWLRGNP